MRGQVQRGCVQERKVEGAGEEDGWSVCAWGGSEREGGGNGRRWKWKVSEQERLRCFCKKGVRAKGEGGGGVVMESAESGGLGYR